MSLFLDVLTVAILVVTVFRAYRRGLLRAVIELAGTLAAFAVAGVFSTPLGDWLDRIFMGKYVHGTLQQAVSGHTGSAQTGFIEKLLNQLSGAFDKTKAAQALDALHLHLPQAGKTMADMLAQPLAQVLSHTLAFCVAFSLCLAAVGMLARLSDAVFHIPVLGSLNALAGAAAGLAEAMLLLFFLSTLVSLFLSFLALGKNPAFTEKQVQATHVYKYVEQANPVPRFLNGK